jgi:hypothetical protein
MDDADNRRQRERSPSQTVHWVIAVALTGIAVALWLRPGDTLLPTALAQNQPLAGARGVFAFTGPLDRDQYGLFMLDVDQGTIWCYAFDVVGGTRKLRLIAARTWVYDRYLQDFNCAKPDFREIQALVTQQRERSTGAAPKTPGDPPAPVPPETKPPGN